MRGFVLGAAMAGVVGSAFYAVGAAPDPGGQPPAVADAFAAAEEVEAVSSTSPTTSPATTTSSTTTLPPTTTSTSTTSTVPPTTSTSTTTTTTVPPTTTTTTTVPPTTTSTTTTTTTTPSGGDPPGSLPLGEAELLALLGAYFSPEDVEVAYWVVRCESNFDAAAYNPSGPYVGLFQHALSAWDSRAASVGFPGADWWNAEANVAASIPLWYGAPPYDASWHWPYCHGWALDQIGG